MIYSVAAGLFVAGALLKLFVFDFGFYMTGFETVFRASTVGETMLRLLHLALVPALLGIAWHVYHHRSPHPQMAAIYGYTAIGLLFICSSLEWSAFLRWHLPLFKNGGLSAWWAVFASGLITAGIWKEVRSLRFMGLALSTIVILKVFLSDFAGMPAMFRMIAFFVIGLVMLFGSFAYIRANRHTEKSNEKPIPASDHVETQDDK